MKFWDSINFEKIILGFMFLGSMVVAAIKYMFIGDVSTNWVYVIFGIGSLFTGRKIASFFKPDRYYQNMNIDTQDNNQNIINTVNVSNNQDAENDNKASI